MSEQSQRASLVAGDVVAASDEVPEAPPAVPGDHDAARPPFTLTTAELTTPVWVYDTLNHRIHWANAAALELWEAPDLDELRARDFLPDTSQAVDGTLREYLDEFAAGRVVTCWWQITPRGHAKKILMRLSGVRLEDGHLAMLCEGLLESTTGADAAALLADSVMVVSGYDADGVLQSANPPFRALFDDDMVELAMLFADPDEARRLLLQAATPGARASLDARMRTRNGTRWHALELRHRGAAAEGPVMLLLQTDIHERKARELEHARQAVTDPLTGLANRAGIRRRLESMSATLNPFSLFYIDLDGFKLINDTFGHAVGDALLQQVAERLESLAGDGATLGRIGGDEFVIAAHADDLHATPDAFATWLVEHISRPYRVERIGSLSISTSVGIARHPEHGTDLDELLANADTAMYAAKAQGRRRWICYAPGMRDSLQRRTLVAQALPGAGSRGELWLAYQPIIDARDRRIVAVEALLRWHCPRLGVVPPLETIAAAEETGLIGALEDWVTLQAGRDLKRLRRVYPSDLVLNLNVSGRRLAQADFAERLEQRLHGLGLGAADVVLELSEASMVPDASGGSVAAELAAAGYRLAIDDFGTGYSCLAYLHQLPATSVKIDRAFVERLADDTATIACIHKLAESFGMQTVAEGVETACQSERLVEIGVHLQQGFLHAHPRRAHDLLATRASFG